MKFVNVALLPIILLSFTQFCTTNEIAKEENTIARKPLSHGSASVSCIIREVFEREGKTIAVAEIDTVHGYGPGTKPLGTGTKMELIISRMKESATEKEIKNSFEINKQYRIIIALIEEGLNSSPGKSWRIISREK